MRQKPKKSSGRPFASSQNQRSPVTKMCPMMRIPMMTTLPKRKPKKPRDHVPELSKLELEAALERLKTTGITSASQNILADTLKAAANSQHSNPAVIVRSLPSERQKMVT